MLSFKGQGTKLVLALALVCGITLILLPPIPWHLYSHPHGSRAI